MHLTQYKFDLDGSVRDRERNYTDVNGTSTLADLTVTTHDLNIFVFFFAWFAHKREKREVRMNLRVSSSASATPSQIQPRSYWRLPARCGVTLRMEVPVDRKTNKNFSLRKSEEAFSAAKVPSFINCICRSFSDSIWHKLGCFACIRSDAHFMIMVICFTLDRLCL